MKSPFFCPITFYWDAVQHVFFLCSPRPDVSYDDINNNSLLRGKGLFSYREGRVFITRFFPTFSFTDVRDIQDKLKKIHYAFLRQIGTCSPGLNRPNPKKKTLLLAFKTSCRRYEMLTSGPPRPILMTLKHVINVQYKLC